MTALWSIVGIGLLGAWLPVETRPGTAVAISTAVLLLIPWAWARTDLEHARRAGMTVLAWGVLILFGLSGGWDRSQGLAEIALVFAVLTVVWLASRARPSSAQVVAWAIGIAALSVWGLIQSWGGLEQVRPAVEQLPPHLKVNALLRIDQGRAFASLYLPGHLAALLATALPILVCRIRRDIVGIFCAVAAVIATMGLVATRSPIGGLLAVVACIAILAARRSRIFHAVYMVPVAVVVLATGLRPDVLEFEPLLLRIDNWSSALWAWMAGPFGSVGCGGFGQASQAVPWDVGNHPVHAHSLPFEWLAELGLAGLVAWFVLMIWLMKTAISLWRSRPELAVALLVIPVHNMLDFSLYTSGVALPWAVLAGWCLAVASAREPSVQESQPLRIVPVVAAACALALALLNAAGAVFEIAAEQKGQQQLQQALRAAAVAPWRTGPVDLAGRLALESDDPTAIREAADLVRRRRWQRPYSASRAQLLGRLAILENDPAAAVADLWQAGRAQPHDPRRREDYEQLVDQLSGRFHAFR